MDALEDTNKILLSIFKEHGYENVKVSKNTKGGKCYGFLSTMEKVTIEADKNGETECVDMVVKMCPRGFDLTDLPIDVYWKNETFIYKYVFPAYDNLQKNLCDKFLHAYCYKSIEKELLIMEDLKYAGFEMCKLTFSLDLEHSVLVLKQLAKFHALSFVHKHRHPEIFESFSALKWDEEMIYKGYTGFIDGAVKFATEKCESKQLCEVLNKYKSFDYTTKTTQLLLGTNKYTAVSHGDVWANNTMFKYEGNKPTDVILLDYQISYLCSPFVDLFYMMFIAIDENTRENYFKTLLSTYENSFRQYIAALGENPDELYPKVDYQKDLKVFSYAGVSLALVMLPHFTNGDIDIKTIDQEEVKRKYGDFLGKPVANEIYKKRIHQMAIDVLRHNLDEYW